MYNNRKNYFIKSSRFFLIIIIIFSAFFTKQTKGFAKDGLIKTDYPNESATCENKSEYSQVVFICTGPYAEAYHSTTYCPGLANCKSQIQYTTEDFAVSVLGRRPCCRCCSNLYMGCKDDNPNASGLGGASSGSASGGSGGAAVIAFVAVSAVFITAAIVSNDIYIYPTYSFYNKEKNFSDNPKILKASNTSGWCFGFRKTLKNSALEYGASLLQSKVYYNDGAGYFHSEEFNRWGGHFNFVQQLFPNKTPKWIKPYVGPSVNYVYDFGYGGILGAEIKVLSRLKFDFRYEYTTQTNQIQAGIIFKYQKRYLWQSKK